MSEDKNWIVLYDNGQSATGKLLEKPQALSIAENMAKSSGEVILVARVLHRVGRVVNAITEDV